MMIDQALEQKPADFDALLKLLEEMGCEVSRRGQASHYSYSTLRQSVPRCYLEKQPLEIRYETRKLVTMPCLWK